MIVAMPAVSMVQGSMLGPPNCRIRIVSFDRVNALDVLRRIWLGEAPPLRVGQRRRVVTRSIVHL